MLVHCTPFGSTLVSSPNQGKVSSDRSLVYRRPWNPVSFTIKSPLLLSLHDKRRLDPLFRPASEFSFGKGKPSMAPSD